MLYCNIDEPQKQYYKFKRSETEDHIHIIHFLYVIIKYSNIFTENRIGVA